MTPRERIAAILSEVLRERVDPAQEYTREQAANWDSLNHLRIVLAFEEEFGVSLQAEEVVAVRSLSDLERLAQRNV
jgi:acyl carrier protein